MAKLEIIAAASAARRLAYARGWLEQRSEMGGSLILAPTHEAASDFVREYMPIAFGAHRASPLQFATELAAAALSRQRLIPISPLGREALAARCIATCAASSGFEALGPVERTPGLPRALASTLSDLRLFEVSSSELSSRGRLATDLARLLAEYERELDARLLVDEAALLELATQELESSDPALVHHAVGLPIVLLDITPENSLERQLYQQLVDRSSHALATTIISDSRARRAFGGGTITELDEQQGGSLDRIRRNLFRSSTDSRDDSADGELEFFAAPGEGRECVEIARAIHESTFAYDRIVVALRKPAVYAPLLEEAFSRAGIPAYFSRGTVRPHPAGRAFLALLTCAEENLSASRFAEYLSLGQVPALADDGGPPSDPVSWVLPETDRRVDTTAHGQSTGRSEPTDSGAGTSTLDSPAVAGTLRVPRRWERLLVDAAVVGGKQRWQNRLRGLGNEIRLQLRELDRDPEADDRRELLDSRLELLDNLQRFALPVIDELDRLPSAASWGTWLTSLERLATHTLRTTEEVLAVLAELRPMEAVENIGLGEVLRVLGPRLRSLRAQRPQRRYGRVLIASIDECRGRSFDLVLLPGLAEGMFPARSFEDPLLLDGIKAQLDSDLPTQRERVARERLRLRIAVGAARSRLVFSYPNLDALHGRSRVPSFYALDLLRARDGSLPSLDDLAKESRRDAMLGWPAPSHPTRAIDDAEYDLAVLAPLLRSGERGGARYLLATNESLRRSLRARYRRWQKTFSRADGLVDPDPRVLEILDGHRLRTRSYSPTALQRFAACPYQFLLQAIHRLRPRETVSAIEQLDPLTRGSIFHHVQFELFTELDQRGLLPMRAARVEDISRLADEVLERNARTFFDRLCPAIPRVWNSEIESLRIDLQGWIRTVVESDEEWRPERFELTFGLPRRPPGGEDHDGASFEAASILDGMKIRGAIDVVERNLETGVLRITDHKTGRAASTHALTVGGGEILQPLLYSLAVEQLLQSPVESGRLFYATRRGNYRSLQVPLDARGRRDIERVLTTIDHSIAIGFLPAAPRARQGRRAGACTYCDYRAVCGPLEELRTGDKSRQRLIALDELRRMP